MNKSYQLLVFDWDGTLMDSTARIVDCLRIAIDAAGLPMRSVQQLRHIIGLGLNQAVDYLFPDGITATQRHDMIGAYRQQYMLSNPTPSRLYEGVPAMLASLQRDGYYLAVATGKSRAGLEQVFDITGLRGYFPVSRCADETCSKPDPTMLKEIICDYDVPIDRVLMIGDTEFDIEMGKRAGVDTVGVAQGAHSREQLQLSGPLAILEQIHDLLSWLPPKAA